MTTSLHILILFSLSVIYFLNGTAQFFKYMRKNEVILIRLYTSQRFILGLQDIFVSFMLWFVMQNTERPSFVEDHLTGELY